MNNYRLLNNELSYFRLDKNMIIVEVNHFDNKLFFGVQPILGQHFDQTIDKISNIEAKIVADVVYRAWRERRNSCSEYLSEVFDNSKTYVEVRVEYQGESGVYVYLIDLNNEIHNYSNAVDRIELQKKYENLYNQTMTILNAIPMGITIHSKDGVLEYMNDSCGKIFGVTPQSLVDRNINIFEIGDVNKKLQDTIQKGIGFSDRITFDIIDVNSDVPKKRHADFYGCPVKDANGQMYNYVFIVNDITEKVQIHEKLQSSHKKIETAIKSTDLMLWEYDVKEVLFYSSNEVLNNYNTLIPITNEQYLETVHPDDKHIMVDIMARMGSGEDFEFCVEGYLRILGNDDWQYCVANGRPFEYDDNGKVIKYVGTRRNINELHRSKIFLEKILNNIPIPIHIKDVENGFKYHFCNDESIRMLGSSIDKNIYDIVADEAVEHIQKTDYETYRTGKPYTGHERIVLKDGRSYETIVRKSMINDGGKDWLLTSRWDQSLQNDLMRRSKLLTLTMEVMNAFTWFFDLANNSVSYGDGFDKIGIKSTKINTLDKYIECIHPEDRELFRGSLQRVIDNENGVWDAEYRLDIIGDGEYNWWQTRGVFEQTKLNEAPYKYMFGMTLSIDEHKKTELRLIQNKKELKELISRNELILNNSNSGLAYISTDYIVQWENLSTCFTSLSYEAYKKGELCYKSAHNRTSPCDKCVMQRAIVSKQVEHITFDLDNNHKVEVFATPVILDNGEVAGVVSRIDDVTDRERIIAELRQAKQQAEQSDKLKSAFLANMSHEIRTPLNAIVGFSEMLLSCSDQDKEEYMHIINTNNALLLKLINDILDLSKIEAGSIDLQNEEFDLSSYFDGLSSSMKQRIHGSNVRLITSNPYQRCDVLLDCNRVAQILTNYVTNSIKYTPKGFIEMGYECRPGGIYLYVKDSGIGIADDKKDKVFHRFEKLDEFAQGTGLGLSICKAIAETMGGRVGYESQFGEGSTFWAELPCEYTISDDSLIVNDYSTLDDNRSEKPKSDDELSRRKVILIVEDILSNYQLLSAMLTKDYELIHAVNGKIAIEIIKQHHVDLVFMDMKMPVMNGLVATNKIRGFNKILPIIALTAHAFDSDREAAICAGCNDYLVKPINKAQIMSVLKKYKIV